MKTRSDAPTAQQLFPLSLDSKPRTPKEAFRNIRNFLAGQFVGATRDDVLLEEVIKCLFAKLQLEHETASIPEDQIELATCVRKAFGRVRAEFPEIFPADTEVLLDPASISCVFQQTTFPLFDLESDPVGDAFEVFVGSESRGNSGQFFTPKVVTDMLADLIAPQIGETVLDPACGAGGFLRSVCARHVKNGASISQLRKWIRTGCFGIDKDAHLAHLANSHLALLAREHPQILCGDSLALQVGSKSLYDDYIPKRGVDVILTNPPFGVRIVAARQEILDTFELARGNGANTPPQVLFVERCFSLLKPGGRLGIVLPESLLSNKSYRAAVDYILREGEVLAVIGMPEALFKTSGKGGTHTKTCLLLARKRDASAPKSHNHPLFMAEAKWCGHDSRARTIPNNDLPAVSENYKSHSKKKLKLHTSLGFVVREGDIKGSILCPRYYDPQGDAELEAMSGSHNLVKFRDLVADGALELSTGDEIGKLAYGTGTIPFIRTSDISNWEIKADPKHGVSEEIYDRLKQKQDVRAGDILLVKDGTYLIGTCAYVTPADVRILYQSHLYKLRLTRSVHGLTPELLLASLSSTAVQRQIRAKQFTQDIIDSLGNRIHELTLPIPKDAGVRAAISEKVAAALAMKIQARELARSARELVVALP